MREFDARSLIGVAAGILFIAGGVLAWTGRWRRWTERYFNPHLPFYFRNTGLLLVPIGILFLTVAVSSILMNIGGAVSLLGFILLIPTALLLAVIWLLMYRPPRWLKPKWLLEEETDRGPVPEPTGVFAVVDFLTLIIPVGLVGLLIVGWVLIVTDVI